MRAYKKTFKIPRDYAVQRGFHEFKDLSAEAFDRKVENLAKGIIRLDPNSPVVHKFSFHAWCEFWHREGRKILAIGPNLAAALIDTDVSDIRVSDVVAGVNRLGGNLYIAFTQPTLVMPIDDCVLEGIHVVSFNDGLTSFSWSSSPHTTKYGNFGSITIDNKATIQQAIAQKIGNTPDQNSHATDILRAVVGTVLYAASAKADVEDLAPESWIAEIDALERNATRTPSAKKKAKLLEKVRKMRENPRDVVTYLGPKIERELAEGESAERAASGERGPLVKHLVRGHWHTYLSGPGKLIRQLQWTHPYTRGTVPIGDTIVKIRESVAEELAI